jgi:hypothetical protein
MFFDPRALFMLAVLVGVSGYVLRGLMVTWHRLKYEGKPSSAGNQETEERLRKLEAATSSLLVDVHGMREKERFMARLQAGAAPRENPARSEQRKVGELSPLVTQNIPVIPRTGSY